MQTSERKKKKKKCDAESTERSCDMIGIGEFSCVEVWFNAAISPPPPPRPHALCEYYDNKKKKEKNISYRECMYSKSRVGRYTYSLTTSASKTMLSGIHNCT